MRALVATGTPELVDFAEVPLWPPEAEEALVDVRAVSVNRGELHRLAAATRGWRPGWDFAGVVARPAWSGAGPGKGARVFGMAAGGAWAEQVTVPVGQLASIPDGVAWECAAALPTAALTALRMLRAAGDLRGRTVLVTGAAGGVGRFAIQLARQAGARVTAVVGRPERAGGLDADEVSVGIGLLEPGFDLILESVGGDSLREAFRLVAPQGTIVSFGNSSRAVTRLEVSDFYPKEAVLRGFYVLNDLGAEPLRDDLQYLVELLTGGRLRADIATVADWRNVRAVLADLRERRMAGKAVLHVSAGEEA